MKPLSPIMTEVIEALQQHGSLVRWRGGYWTYPGCPARANDAAIPEQHWGTLTIDALVSRGLLTVDEKFERGGAKKVSLSELAAKPAAPADSESSDSLPQP